MPLDPQAQAVVDQIQSMGAPGFFGMTAVMDKAATALGQATAALRKAFE